MRLHDFADLRLTVTVDHCYHQLDEVLYSSSHIEAVNAELESVHENIARRNHDSCANQAGNHGY